MVSAWRFEGRSAAAPVGAVALCSTRRPLGTTLRSVRLPLTEAATKPLVMLRWVRPDQIVMLKLLRESRNKNLDFFATFFAIGNSSPPWQRGNKPLHSHFRRVFGQQSAIGEIATIPNRKKVATKAEFLFLSSRGDFRMAL